LKGKATAEKWKSLKAYWKGAFTQGVGKILTLLVFS